MGKFLSYASNPSFRLWWAFLATAAFGFAAWAAFSSGPGWLWIATALATATWLAAWFTKTVKFVEVENRGNAERGLVSEVIERLTDAVIIYDENFTITTINVPAERAFGITKIAVESVKVDPSFVKRPGLRSFTQVMFPSLAPAVTQVSESGAWPSVVRIVLENPHQQLLVTTNRFPVNNGFIKIVRDETSEQTASKTKEEFISVAAHQLRTPLTAIHWALEGIVQSAKTSGDGGTLAIAEEGLKVSERSLKIANDLLDAAKVEEGRYTAVKERFSIRELVERVVGEVRPIAARYGIVVSASVPDGEVTADQNGISMALFNFIDNAVRYNTPNGKVAVSGSTDGSTVKITVADTGVGIPQEDIGRVFEKLHRGSNVVQMEPNGSGLGMYIAKNIIEQNGGAVGVESVVNRGTTVWFTVPLVRG